MVVPDRVQHSYLSKRKPSAMDPSPIVFRRVTSEKEPSIAATDQEQLLVLLIK